MPNSQFHRVAKETTQSRMTNCSADLSFPPDTEFLELLCENGQILMQGQSSRNRKNLSYTGFSYPTSKGQAKDGGDAVTPKIGKFGNMDGVLNDFSSSSAPNGHMGLGQDDDIVPWLNYPLDNTLQHDLGSDFFSELTGVNLNAFSPPQSNLVPFDKNSSYSQMMRDSHLASEPIRPRSSQLYSSPLKECQTSSIPSLRPRVSDFISSNPNNTHQALCRNSIHTPAGSQPKTKTQKQDLGHTRPSLQPNGTVGLMNFSHFSRPAALVKASLQSISAAPSPSLSTVDRLKTNDKICPVSSNPVDSTLIDLTGGSRSVTGFQNPPVPMGGKVDLEPSTSKPSKELSAEQSGAICREDASRVTRLPDQILRQSSSFAIGRLDTEKNVEPPVASSSMCSGNSAGGASNDPKHNLKRKSREADESEYQSDDVEEESVGVRKPGNARGGTGAKRSRAAEVHNLSERRRRDRINEKMRALQELIPNCNKVDKASMLDEAIEYLKTLQLQVQIMSMGTGLYMPPMILPPGMQRIPGQHLPHFPPIGVGMGMGMGMGVGVGYGMGLFDMSGGSSMMQVPPMHNMQFPSPPLSGPNNFLPMPGSSLPMFGIPGQGLPASMPRAPYIPPSEGPFTKSVPVPEVSGTVTPAEIPGSVSCSCSKDARQNMNSQMMQNKNAQCSQNQTSQATAEGFEQSAAAQRNNQTEHVVAINPSNGNGMVASTATGLHLTTSSK